jgi:S-adenosylhomocysteine hydrolase
MQKLILPLVESLITLYNGPDFSKTKIIGVQHIVESNHAMIQSLYQLGLKPQNVSIVGKCYSTCIDVYKEMLDDGIDVDKGSLAYSSHLSFDEQFEKIVNDFASVRINDISSGDYDRIIVLDDGGKLISLLSKYDSHPAMVAIEQTTAGYEAIRTIPIKFPIINVARSPVKLKNESPMIANVAVENLYLILQKRRLVPEKALIIGCGAIGNAMKKRLASNMEISVYDKNTTDSVLGDFELLKMFLQFPLIVGCTGTISIPSPQFHPLFFSEVTLVSVSSSDREFDAVHLRKLLPENNCCHEDIVINDCLLVNSGFPINFNGNGRRNIDPMQIQVTIALMIAGILQAQECSLKARIIKLDSDYEKIIERNFSSYN